MIRPCLTPVFYVIAYLLFIIGLATPSLARAENGDSKSEGQKTSHEETTQSEARLISKEQPADEIKLDISVATAKATDPAVHNASENNHLSDAEQRLQQVIDTAMKQGLITSTEESSNKISQDSEKKNLLTENTKTLPAVSKLRSVPNVLNEMCTAEVFELPKIRDATDAFKNVNALRSDLLNDNGEYDANIILELSKLYLSLGMAEEARSLSQLKPSRKTRVITEMAKVVMGEPLLETAILNQKIKCTDLSTVWVALANLDKKPLENLETLYEKSDSVKKFSPWLAQILHKKIIYESLKQGKIDIASEFSRVSKEETLYSVYIDALVKAAEGDEIAVATLGAISQKPNLYKDDAVLWISRFKKRRPTDQYPEIVEDLEDLAATQKSKEVKRNLLHLRMQSLLETKKYIPLFDILRIGEISAFDKAAFEDILMAQLAIDLASDDPLEKARALSALFAKRPVPGDYWQKSNLQTGFLKATESLNLPHVLSEIVQDFDKEQLHVMNSPEILWAEYSVKPMPPLKEIESTISADPRVLIIWVNNLRRNQRYPEAIQLLEKKIKIASPALKDELVLMLATTAWEARNWLVAARALTEVVKVNPSKQYETRLLMAKYMLGVSTVKDQQEWIAFQGDVSVGIDQDTAAYLVETTAKEIKLLEEVLTNG